MKCSRETVAAFIPSGRPRLLIVGGSTRAAAGSALRAGCAPICADLFADLDLRQMADVISVRDYPTSLCQDVAEIEADGWFFTGAMENHPDIVSQMEGFAKKEQCSRIGSSLGTSAKSLRLVRDPVWLSSTLRDAGVLAPEVRSRELPPNADGSWLLKPVSSGGGVGIRIWDETASTQSRAMDCYFQKFVPGKSYSGIFQVIRGVVKCVGVTRQFIGAKESKVTEPFGYSASLGPVALTTAELLEIERIGQLIGSTADLNGLFGIDFITNHWGVWTIEVNPRYTASVEVIELAYRRSLLGKIVDVAIREGTILHENDTEHPQDRFVGKMILYAPHSVVVGDLSGSLNEWSMWRVPFLADIPATGSEIRSGWPICSVFAEGTSPKECWGLLVQRVNETWVRLGFDRVESSASPFEF